jgi:hypothetical protein
MKTSHLTLLAASTVALAACSDGGGVAPRSADISPAETRAPRPASYMNN